MITSGCYSCLDMTSDSSGISDANDASDVMSMFNSKTVDTPENGSDSDVADDVNTRVCLIKSSPQVSYSCNSVVNLGVNTFIIVVGLVHMWISGILLIIIILN